MGLPAEMTERMDTKLQTTCLTESNGLRGIVTDSSTSLAKIHTVLKSESQHAVHDALKQIDVAGLILTNDDSCDLADRLRTFMEAAQYGLPGCSGARRLLLITPSQYPGSALKEAILSKLEQDAAQLSYEGSDVLIGYEMEGLPLADVAQWIIQGSQHTAKLASRLHTRTDVEWKELTFGRASTVLPTLALN